MTEILVLHTGGTIGMVPGPAGLAPVDGVVETAVQKLLPDTTHAVVHAFRPLVDSAEIGPDHWNRMIEAIARFHGSGVVITHGTDTMAFTGAALSRALAGIGMPIVLCGSMQPLNHGGDAEANLALALEAAQRKAAGVWLAFAGKLLPAAGLVKQDSHAADAFRSTDQPSLPGPFRPHRFADLRLAILTLSPELPPAALAAILEQLDGAVLRVFGAGTISSDPELQRVLAKAIGRGCRIRAVSQCENGGLEPGAYAAGASLWRTGVENGGTETAEAALARLWFEMSG
ncbi:asparaginase domain-containing protein [Paracoccus onubensis]|uniref:asparaginase domain-containing protein n=1 Tax=Paracoccus onubensis TaxID=1675788 RepID=UPI002731CF53|nr:asparaginase domain-containing protein [Paracoccus onubensis]MDP0928980.1 asparaginase domain-containing protein [Paracoccus onubensis]